MNNNIRRSHLWRNFFILGFVLIIIIAIALTLYLLKQQTNQRSKAAPSTTLSFSPSSLTVGVGQPVSADINLDPGSNQVSLLKLVISYDSTKFDSNTAVIKPSIVNPTGPNSQGFIKVIQPFANNCNGNNCLMSLTLSIGADPTSVITQPVKAATILLNAIATTDSSGSTIAIDPSTQVLSLSPTDQPNENVLLISSLAPLTVNIGNGIISPTTTPTASVTPTPTPIAACVPNQSTCSWGSVTGVVSYHYKITDITTGKLVQEADVDASQTSVQFPSVAGDTYTCSVSSINSCSNKSSAGQATQTCPLPPTPTPTSCPAPGTVKNLRLICPNCSNQ